MEEELLLGAVMLRKYIDKAYDGSENAFALDHGFNQSELNKFLRGKRTRMSVDMATQIERATGGMVRVKMWSRDA